MSKPAKPATMLRALILDAEALLDRHLEVLGREPIDPQDHEVYELRETLKDAKDSLRATATQPPEVKDESNTSS